MRTLPSSKPHVRIDPGLAKSAPGSALAHRARLVGSCRA